MSLPQPRGFVLNNDWPRKIFGTPRGPLIAVFTAAHFLLQLHPTFPAHGLVLSGAQYLVPWLLSVLGVLLAPRRNDHAALSRKVGAVLFSFLAILAIGIGVRFYTAEMPVKDGLYLLAIAPVFWWMLLIDPQETVSKEICWTIAAFTLLSLAAWFAGFSIFFRGDVYEGSASLLQWRFAGFSTTNTLALSALFAATLLACTKWHKPWERSDTAAVLVLVVLSLLLRGRAAGMVVLILALIGLSRTAWRGRDVLAWAAVIASCAAIIVSLQIATVPLSSRFPFFDMRPSLYAAIHQTYMGINRDHNWFGRSDREIAKTWPRKLDRKRLDEALTVIAPAAVRADEAKKYQTFKAPHSSLLYFWAHFGTIGALIFLFFNAVMTAGYFYVFRFALPTQIAVLNLSRLWFEGGGLITVFLAAFQLAYLVHHLGLATKRSREPAGSRYPAAP